MNISFISFIYYCYYVINYSNKSLTIESINSWVKQKVCRIIEWELVLVVLLKSVSYETLSCDISLAIVGLLLH
jgi:hypothetical protein